LPTLISRGWVLTLPWPEAGVPFSEEMRMWESALAEFAAEGRGWFDKTLERNSVDAVKAQQIVLVGQKSLADALAGRQRGRLSALFRRLPGELLMQLDELFVESQDALQAQVNPLLVLDRMASALYSLSGSSKRMS
jgi:DNA polymerase-3 subunit delta'